MKNDVVHTVLNFVDHNRYAVASVLVFILAMGLVLNLTGCQATTAGLITTADGQTPKVSIAEFQRQALVGEKDFAVHRIELDAQIAAFNEEVKTFNDRVAAGLDDLTRQEEFKQQLVDTLGMVAVNVTEGTFNPTALVPIGIGLLGGALGLGTSADNRRKDKVITNLKATPSAAA